MIPQMYVEKIMEMYEKKGLSIKKISKNLGHSRNTISRYVNGGKFGYHRSKSPQSPLKNFVKPLLKAWYQEDLEAPRKQRRTATKMYTDLKNHYDYSGSYSTVKAVLLSIKGSSKEVFIPRDHKPGEYLEFDFGEAWVEFASERKKVYMHAFQLTYSNDIFCYVSLRQTQEEMFHSHKLALEHFEGIPQKIRYDNLKQAVKKVLKGSLREENDSFRTFKDQFGFEAEFCAVAKGNQKGDVEGCVGYVRRNFLSPIPKLSNLADLDNLNKELAFWCKSLRKNRQLVGTDKTVGEAFCQEKMALGWLPTILPDVGKKTTAKANHQSLISVAGNFYSVPDKYAYQIVDVLVSAREIVVFHKSEEIARHKRCFEKGQQIFNPVHYLVTFRKKPFALLNSKPIKELPDVFCKFFYKARLKGHGSVAECIAVLELLKEFSIKDVAEAIELAIVYDTYYISGVKNLLAQLKTDQPKIQSLKYFKKPDLKNYQVPSVDLSRYDQLIRKGDHVYV